MELNKENIKKILGIITFTLILYFILKNIPVICGALGKLMNVMSPFWIGIAIAFVLNIPMAFFEKKLFKDKKTKSGKIKKSKIKRPVSIVLSLIVVVLVISFIIKLVIPQFVNIIVIFASNLPEFANDLKDWALSLTSQYPDISRHIQSIEIDWNSVVNDIINLAKNLSATVVKSSFSFIISVIGRILNFIISLIFAIYILSGKEHLAEQIKKVMKAYLSEDKVRSVLDIAKLSKETFQNFITGQCTEAVILGLLCFVGMIVFGLPYAVTVSVLIGVTALIPVVGAYLGAILGAIFILSIEPIKSVVFIIFILILQQIEGNVIYPRVVGNSVGLPGIWVLLTVIVGGSLGGVLGILIGLPLISVFYALLRRNVNKKLENSPIGEED